MDHKQPLVIRTAVCADHQYAELISQEMASSARARGTGIAQRSVDYIRLKMSEGKAVIALTHDGAWAGFCYIEAWGHEKFVANSGLIVSPDFRGIGVAKAIKHKVFQLSREKYPEAKIFGLTTGLAVMKINSELGYEPVTYSELTDDEQFWTGCKSCVNYDILMSKGKKNCICTAMLYNPAEKEKQQPKTTAAHKPNTRKKRRFKDNFKLFERWIRFKKHVLLKRKDAKKHYRKEMISL